MNGIAGAPGRLMQGANAGRTVAGFCVLLVALLWAGAFVEASLDRDRSLAREMAENAGLVRVLEETVARVLKNADQVVLMVKNRYEREGRKFDLQQYVRDGMISTQPYNIISIADEAGHVVHFSEPSGPVSIADREHFQVHRLRDTGKLYVGKPALGRTTGKWTLYLTRRINKPDGSFGGVAVVGLDPAFLSEIFRRIDLGEGATVTLIGLDGFVRARESDGTSTPGQDVSNTPLLTERVRASGSASYVDTSRIDNVTRVFSYRVMRDYPLVMLVGTAQAAALAASGRRATMMYWGAGIASAAILLFAALFGAQAGRRTRSAQRQQIELERQVGQRTAKLLEANRDLEAFTYSVSHDLRTPLRAITGFAQILARRQRDRLDDQGRHYLDNIVEASGHMGRLIDELLTYSRLGRSAVEARPVALADVFAKILAHLQPRIEILGARATFPPYPPAVEGDEILVYQVFLNLVDNALTYCKPGIPPVVEVSFCEEGGQVTVAVADRGIGIDPEHFETIFGVFQRLHRQDEYPGTGIGLATVRRSVELIGGAVWVESAPGSGSTFFVRLKRSADE